MVPALFHHGRHGVGKPARALDVMHFTGQFPMPQLSPISVDVALLAGRAVFLVVCFVLAAVAFTRWRRASHHLAERFDEHSTATTARLADIADALTALNRRLDEMAERQEGEGRRAGATGVAAPSYQIAIRLARSGAPREDLMASCGLTRQEAELVQRLHAPPRQPRLVVAG
jgi:hypothetical protein